LHAFALPATSEAWKPRMTGASVENDYRFLRYFVAR
jgi:hypothetical protein